MKSRLLTCSTAITLFTVLAMPLQFAAPDNKNTGKHHHYKLIDLGTLGGPQSFFSGNINDAGTAVGVGDTTTSDPFYPNANPLINTFGADPFVYHAFQWKDGEVIDLGALPGANSSWASWISSNGLVAGQSINGTIDPLTGWPEENAVLWKDSQITNLGTLGGYESGAGSVNRHGQIAGFSGNAVSDSHSMFGLGTETRAFLWDKENGMQDLSTLGGPDAFAFTVNEGGQIAGASYLNTASSSNCPFPLITDPFLWDKNKTMIDLGTLGGTCGLANALNNRGQVVGQSNLAGDQTAHPFLWSGRHGKMRDLGTLGGTFGTATALNDAGEVVGGATTTGDSAFHAFFWKGGVMTDLGTVAGYDCTQAFGINSRSQVVGQAVANGCAGPGAHAFLWEDGHIIDLNVFVPPDSELTLGDVEHINDQGEMFGNAALPNGDVHAFVLIPCDEHHPGVEGCDYSLVDAIPVAQASAVSRDVIRGAQRLSPPPRTNEFHMPGFTIGPRN